jgi:hypothetical protein
MLLLSDDNYGNLRTVPAPDKRDRKAGWGIYYHFDYHGGPISYEWVNSTPITKAWEQLTAAYTYGIRDLWVANVGDLRPCELPLSYFLNLAFDFDYRKEPNRTGEFLEKWVDEQFGGYVDQNIRGQIARIINEYTRMNGDRRPEAVHADTFGFSGNNEALHELRRAEALISRVEAIRTSIPSERADAFFGLVEYPALASANLRKMMIYTGMHRRFSEMKVSYANVLREKILACIAEDVELMRRYNEDMSGGKWRHMMSSKHVSFRNWNDEGSEYPGPEELVLPDQGQTIVCLFESGRYASEGELELPLFSSVENSKHRILLLSTDTRPVCAKLQASEDWIVLSERKIAPELTEIEVSILWREIDRGREGFVEISSGTGAVAVHVAVEKHDLSEVASGAFPETTGVISMPGDAFSRKSVPGGTDWIRIDNYGKSGVSMKVLPSDVFFETNELAPNLEYDIFILHPDRYFITAYIAPTNDPVKGKGLCFAFSVDGDVPVVINTLPEGFAAGDPEDADWCRYVLDNSRRSGMSVDLNEGAHTIRFIHLDAGVVLQKIEVARRPSENFYGYRTTYRKP